jgi:hypothetical protein
MTTRERQMSKYVLSFRGPSDRSPDAQEESDWAKWFEEIGGCVAEFGHRVGRVSVLGSANGSTDVLAGYVVIDAADLDAAVSIAAGCPGLRRGRAVEVGEAVPA